jgi:hypothetical protein
MRKSSRFHDLRQAHNSILERLTLGNWATYFGFFGSHDSDRRSVRVGRSAAWPMSEVVIRDQNRPFRSLPLIPQERSIPRIVPLSFPSPKLRTYPANDHVPSSASKAPFRIFGSHFRSAPNNGHHQTGPVGPVRANRRHQSGVNAGLWEPLFLQYPG